MPNCSLRACALRMIAWAMLALPVLAWNTEPAGAAVKITDMTRDLNSIVNETLAKSPTRALDREGWDAVVKERQCPGPAQATTSDPDPVPLCVRKRSDPPPLNIKIPS